MDALATTALQQNVPSPAAKPVAAAARPAPGNPLPAAGKSPPPTPPPAAEVPEVSIEQAVAQIQSYIVESQRDLQFRVDESSGRTVVSVFDSDGQLIRQFPSAEILKIAATIREQGLSLLNQSV